MTEPFALTDLRTALRFPFQSPDGANRLLVGAALSLGGVFIPILPTLFVHGYVVRVLRQAVSGAEASMPEWNDWGRLLSDGLKSTLIGLLYLAPGSVVLVSGYLLYFVVWIGGLSFLEGVSPRNAPPEAFFVLVFGAIAILFLSLFLGMSLWLAGLLPLPAALAHFAAEDRFTAAFDVPALWRLINADRWGYFLGWVVTLGLVGVIYAIFTILYFTIIFCLVAGYILAPLGFYLLLVAAIVFGQFYRGAKLRLSEAAG